MGCYVHRPLFNHCPLKCNACTLLSQQASKVLCCVTCCRLLDTLVGGAELPRNACWIFLGPCSFWLVCQLVMVGDGGSGQVKR